jgi:hypothetical protein
MKHLIVKIGICVVVVVIASPLIRMKILINSEIVELKNRDKDEDPEIEAMKLLKVE